ncbi:hypothetical protein FRC06_000780 [Ceratobasidium sp. 370]|nr:hypothetical protein FRC06_000780 [Ceratobasidium sp. 370]
MAVSTLDQSIFIWPFSPDGPITALAHEYLLEGGREWHRFEPHTPVAFTSDLKVACGTLDGTIAIISHRGSCIQKLRYAGHCTRALATDEGMIYAAFTSAVGSTTIIAYCNNEARRKRLKGKQLT